MLAKLPDPGKLKQSPLQEALKDPDPALKDPELLRLVGNLRRGDNHEALSSLHRLSGKYPRHPSIQMLHGMLAARWRLFNEAETAFRVAAADAKYAAAAWYSTGLIQYLRNRPKEAAASMRRCLSANPDPELIGPAWTAMAYYQSVSGNTGEAIRSAQEGTRYAPGLAFAWAVRGFCEAAGKHYEEAITDYRKAIAMDDKLAFAHQGLGLTYAVADRPGDAVAPLRKALALRPRDPLAATQLAYCYLRTGKAADGVKVCKQAVAAAPRFSKGWDILGLCYRQMGKKSEARDAFQRAVQTGPDNAPARAHLAEATKAAQA